ENLTILRMCFRKRLCIFPLGSMSGREPCKLVTSPSEESVYLRLIRKPPSESGYQAHVSVRLDAGRSHFDYSGDEFLNRLGYFGFFYALLRLTVGTFQVGKLCSVVNYVERVV